MGSSMTTAEETSTEDSTEMATPSRKNLDNLKVAISKLYNPKTAASGCDQVCQTLSECLKDEEPQEAALNLVAQALVKYGEELKNPRGGKTNPSAKLLEMVFPFMWCDKQSVREAALKVVKMIPTTPRPECWNKLKTDMHTLYCKSLLNMVVTCQRDWPTLWMETVEFFGADLHSGANLINHLLGVLEKAYKNPDVDWTRIQAFECWKALIDSFKKASLNSKRIALILIPLRATNHRTEPLTKAKYETFVHLIKNVPKTQDMHDTLKAFLVFSFYSSGDTLLPLRCYPSMQPLCYEALETAVQRACESKCVARLSKQIFLGFSQTLQLPNVDEEKVKKSWVVLLESISEGRGSESNRDLIRDMLTMLDDLVTVSAGVIRSPPASPNTSSSISSMSMNTSQSSCPPQEELCAILVDLLHELIVGPSALSPSQLASVSLYVGNNVMTGTPALMAVQWLLSPGIVLSSGCTEKYKAMMNHLINASIECLGGPLSFIPKVLKMATKLILSQPDSSSVTESLTSTWCSMAEVMVRWVNAGGELNQGDAASHDFSCLYSVVQFPVTHLCEHTSSWIKVWGQLYQKSSPQVSLVSTTGSHEFCDQIASRLLAAAKSSNSKNRDTRLAAAVACGEAMVRAHKATNSRWGREQDKAVSLLSEAVSLMAATAANNRSEELVSALARCVAQLESPVAVNNSTPSVVESLAPVVLLLLRYPSPSQHLAQQIVSALNAVQVMVEKHWQFPSDPPKEVRTAVNSLVNCAKSHPVRNIRNSGNLLAMSLSGTTPEEGSFSEVSPLVLGSILHPPKDVVGSKSVAKTTVTPTKKTTPANKSNFSLANKSPADSPTGRNKRKFEEVTNGEFVVIKRPTPVKMILTEHQKEVMRRKADIPAMYQDLSQDTQSASQDCVILPSSPANPPKKARLEPEEEAVMDFEDIVPFQKRDKDLDTSVSILEEEKNKKMFGTIEIDDNATMQSVMDTTNEDYLTCSQESVMAERLEDEPVSASPVKDKPILATPNRRKSIVPVRKEPTITRSRNMNNSLVTRSGKLVKPRQSLGSGDFKSPPKRKRLRKSLPATNNRVSSSSESSEDNAPAEAIAESPVKTPTKGRGVKAAAEVTEPLQTASAVTEEAIPDADASKAAQLESTKSSEDTLSAASPSTDSAEPSSSISSSSATFGSPEPVAANKPQFTTPPSLRDRPKRKTTPTRKALLLLQSQDSASRVSLAVAGKAPKAGAKASQVEQPKLGERTLRRSRFKNSFEESDTKRAENVELETVSAEEKSKASPESPFKSNVEPVVVIEKLSEIPARVDKPEDIIETVEIPDSDSLSEPGEQPVVKPVVTEPDVLVVERDVPKRDEPASKLEKPEASEPEGTAELGPAETSASGAAEAPASAPATVAESPASDTVIPESQDIIESSQAPEDSVASITTPRYTESPKKDETPSSAKWTLRVSDTFTPLNLDKNASPTPGTPKAVPAAERDSEKVPRRILDKDDDRTESMPSWMHAKKVVSPGKPARPVHKRISPAELVKVSQGTTSEEAVSGSPPSKPSESTPTPTSSPVQTKWMKPESVTPTGSRSQGSFPMRMGRAAHLLGLGQAAAARSGEEIRATISPGPKEETTAGTATSVDAEATSAPAPSVVPKPSNGLALRASLNGHVIASPRVKRRTKMGLASRFSDGGQSAKEPQTPGSEWIRKTYQPDAIPDTSILKKPRRTAALLESDGSPSSRRKRVSFHDPPVSKSLNFYITSGDDYSGIVHLNGGATDDPDPSSGKSLPLEDKNSEPSLNQWMKPCDEEKRGDSAVTVIVEETEQEMEREGRPNHEESSILRQRNYDDKGDTVRLVATKEDRAKGRNDSENQKNDADDENRWISRTKKDDERVGKEDISRRKKMDEVDEDANVFKEERLRKEAERSVEEENERMGKVEEQRQRAEEERLRKEEEEKARKEEEEERIRKEKEESIRKEEEEKKRKEEEERIRKEEEEKTRKEDAERIRKEEEKKRKEEEERICKEKEEKKREEEEERIRKEEEEKKRKELEERIRKEEEEKKHKEEEERVRKEEEEEKKRKEVEERIRTEEKKKRKEEEERIRKEQEEKERKEEEERIRKEEKEKKRKEEQERIRKEEEEMKRKEEEEKKRKEEEERIRKEEEEKKRKELEESIRKEEEEKKRKELEERIRKEEEEKKHKEEEERIRKEEEEEKKRKEVEERIRKKEEHRIRKEEETKRKQEEERIRREEDEERIRKLEEEQERLKEAERIKKEEEKLEKKRMEDEEKVKILSSKESERMLLKRKESSQETSEKNAVDSEPLKKSSRQKRFSIRTDSEDSSSSSMMDVDNIVVKLENASEIPQDTVKPAKRGRPRKGRYSEVKRRKKEEERKRKEEELEKSDAEWSKKEELRLSALSESSVSPTTPNEAASGGKLTTGQRVDSDLSQIAALSQGDASTTHPILFPQPGAVYPSLVDCDEPISKIIDSLTGTAWRTNLLRKFSDASLTTIGHLASLTEDKLNRFAIRPPRKDTLVKALERYERQCCKTVKPLQEPSCLGIQPTLLTRIADPEDDLPLSSLGKTTEVIPLGLIDPVSGISTETLLRELTNRIGVSGILKQLCENREADVLSALQTSPGVQKILASAPLEGLVEECSKKVESSAEELTTCNGKLVELVAKAVAKDAILERFASALASKSSGKEILHTLFKSVLDHL